MYRSHPTRSASRCKTRFQPGYESLEDRIVMTAGIAVVEVTAGPIETPLDVPVFEQGVLANAPLEEVSFTSSNRPVANTVDPISDAEAKAADFAVNHHCDVADWFGTANDVKIVLDCGDGWVLGGLEYPGGPPTDGGPSDGGPTDGGGGDEGGEGGGVWVQLLSWWNQWVNGGGGQGGDDGVKDGEGVGGNDGDGDD